MEKFGNQFIYVTVLCAVFCFDWSTQDKVHVQIKPTQVLELRQQAEICSQETGVPVAHLKKIIEKTLPDDRPNKEFFFCVLTNTGYLNKDGDFSIEKMLALTIDDSAKGQYENDIKECNKIVKSDVVETAMGRGDCVHSNYHYSVMPQ